MLNEITLGAERYNELVIAEYENKKAAVELYKIRSELAIARINIAEINEFFDDPDNNYHSKCFKEWCEKRDDSISWHDCIRGGDSE